MTARAEGQEANVKRECEEVAEMSDYESWLVKREEKAERKNAVFWLIFCIRESKTKAERVIYGCFVVVGVVLFGMNLYGWWTIRR